MLDIVHEVEHLADAQGQSSQVMVVGESSGAVCQLSHEDRPMGLSMVVDQAQIVQT